MSFKRAGDDHCALRLQKKQRVAELFAEDIPADEVNQTRSGKYICLVCPHNPVLDTMPMLSIHRQGRKHLTNMSIKIEKEHNLNELLQKRKQEFYLKEASINNKPSNIGKNSMELFNNDTSETAPLLAKTRLLAERVTTQSTPNNPQVQKSNLGEKRTMESQGFTNEQPGDIFKKNKPFFQSRVELKLSRDIFDKNLQKSTSTTNNKTDHRLSTGAEKLSKHADGNICGSNTVIQGSKSLSSTAVVNRNDYKSDLQSKLMPIIKSSFSHGSANYCQIEGSTNTAVDGQLVGNNAVDFQQTTECKGVSGKMNRDEQRRYLEMKMSGWILDSNGKWIKDENVEFDSDEEEPL
ncbi:Hypothetical predicted protein [Paramuricea clavata]|uniref:Sodium channel modifier 1 n=1 Tax=Paramuricea clavata TaxID=317549 RepID=A0A7D9JVP8_PARCT|nr:Hypothetical predicted protein [Paramuricea clavata]